MADKRIADVLVDTLVAAAVKNVYGLAGDSLNGTAMKYCWKGTGPCLPN